MDVHHTVMTMSTFCASPRLGHLSRLQRIVSYLVKFKHAAICFRTERPDLSVYPELHFNWEHSVYGGAKEEIPKDCPPLLGKTVDTIMFVDANLLHNMITGRSITRIIHMFNK